MRNTPFILFASGVLAATGLASSAVATSTDDLSLDPYDLVTALGQSQVSSDLLPADSSIGGQAQILPDTVRQLNSTPDGDQWVALSEDGSICLIVHLSDRADGHAEDAGLEGASCTSPANFGRYGASLRLEGAPGNGLVSHLLPSDIRPEDVPSSSRAETQVAPLVSMTVVEADALGAITIQRPNGGEIELYPMTMD